MAGAATASDEIAPFPRSSDLDAWGPDTRPTHHPLSGGERSAYRLPDSKSASK